MAVSVGSIVEGKVTGVTKFGAFVALSEEENGLVHISEISHDYVEKVSDHLEMGQVVKVKVTGIKDGKISLSIKGALPPKRKPPQNPSTSYQRVEPDENLSFEDKINRFFKDSNETISQMARRDKRRSRGHKRSTT